MWPTCGPGVAQISKIRQFCMCVNEAFGDMLLAPAVGDPLLEAVDLIDERPAPHLGCPVLIWVHGHRRYRPSVTQRDASTAPGCRRNCEAPPGGSTPNRDDHTVAAQAGNRTTSDGYDTRAVIDVQAALT